MLNLNRLTDTALLSFYLNRSLNSICSAAHIFWYVEILGIESPFSIFMIVFREIPARSASSFCDRFCCMRSSYNLPCCFSRLVMDSGTPFFAFICSSLPCFPLPACFTVVGMLNCFRQDDCFSAIYRVGCFLAG